MWLKIIKNELFCIRILLRSLFIFIREKCSWILKTLPNIQSKFWSKNDSRDTEKTTNREKYYQ